MFEDFDTDDLFVVSKNGSKSPLIKGTVQRNKIFINRSDVVIETGDEITRVLDGRKDEIYVVISPGFYRETMGFPAHYQVKVEEKSAFAYRQNERNQTGHVINNHNYYGENYRVNNNSTDNSNNTYSNTNGYDVESAIRIAKEDVKALLLSSSESDQTSESLDAVKSQLESESPSKHVLKAIVNSLPNVVKVLPSIVKIIEMIDKLK